jgi:Carboxypeptidase regulatory-like domain/TonB dependent receptor
MGLGMKYARAILLFACVVTFLRGMARASDLASCTGVVSDENGIRVVAAQLKLEDGAGHVFQAETDGTGRFALRNLRAGSYKLEVRKQGFFVLTNREVKLQPGENDLSLTINHAEEVHEQVQVTSGANQIDPQDTAQRDTLSARDILDIPVPSTHVLAQSLVALPEVTQDNSGNLHIAGARSGETQYLLDGFEIGDPTDNTLTARFNVDATRAAEVETGRIGAEYVHSGANILSLATPDGDDRWRFGTTDPIPGINIQEGWHLGNWYPRFTVSGPIIRGKLWFSDSISVQHTFAVEHGLPAGQANTWQEWAGDNLLRLQYNIGPKHILHGSFLYNRAHDTNLGLDALDPQSTTTTANQQRYFGALKDQVWLHDTLFDFGVAADSGTLDYTPQGNLPYVILVDGTTGNFFETLQERGRRVQAIAGVTAASRHWHGTHQLVAGTNVAGVDYSLTAQRGEIQALQALANDGVACTSAAQPGCLFRQTTFSGPANPYVSNTQAGGYAQDTWSVSKFLVLQAGVRADWDRFTQSAIVEPRISGNILPLGDNTSKISLGWGIYNVPLNLSVIGQVYDQQQNDAFFNSAGAVTESVVSKFVLPSGGLQQPRFTNSSAGWQQKIKRNTLLDLELLARNGYHGFAYVDQDPAEPGGLFVLEDHRKDRYRAATISARHIFSENLELYGAYTRSASRSNEVLDPTLGDLFFVAQQPGPTLWDAPNRFISWGWAPTHIWGLQLSYFVEYRTGYPFSAVNLEEQIVGPPNSLRFPGFVNLNLGLEKKFGFRGYLWAARAEAVNILGRLNPDTVVNNVAAPNFGTFAGGQGRAFTLRVRFIGRK